MRDTALACCGVFALALGLTGVSGTAQGTTTAPRTSPLPGSVSPVLRSAAATVTGTAPADRPTTFQLWLRPDLAGAEAFATAAATPGTPAFHRYLSPAAYTARFGPSPVQAAAVADWLRHSGLTQVHTDPGRDYVAATGPAATVEAALRVRIDRYRISGADGGSRTVSANDREVSLPTTLLPDVIGVTGLGSVPATAPRAAVPRAAVPRATVSPAAAPAVRAAHTAESPTCSSYWGRYRHAVRPRYRGLAEAALPICGYSAAQIRAAYGATGTDTGRGQTVALIEDETPTAMFRTLTEYAARNHLPRPDPAQLRIVHAGACGTPSARSARTAAYEDEAEMDAEAVYAMAPGATQLMVVGGGCDENQALLNGALHVLTADGRRPLASIESNSWQIPEGSVPAQTVHALDVRGAAEGVGMYFASGDTPGLTATSADPYAVTVGGTSLGVARTGRRLFETGWSSDAATLDAGRWTDLGVSGGGGGAASGYPQPAYQKGVVPASMARTRVGGRTVLRRTVPDLAADADLDTGLLTGYIATESHGRPGPYETMPNAGTSLACPLVAGLVADAQQGLRTPFGFIDPVLYRLAGTPALHDILPVGPRTPAADRAAYLPADGSGSGPGLDVFDVQNRADTRQVTARGYDTTTGVGTPNGAAFIAGLRREAR